MRNRRFGRGYEENGNGNGGSGLEPGARYVDSEEGRYLDDEQARYPGAESLSPRNGVPAGGQVVPSTESAPGRIVSAPTAETSVTPSYAFRNPLDDMVSAYQALTVKNARLEAGVTARAQRVTEQENVIARDAMKAIFPGGAPDLEKIIAPYFYAFQAPELLPNTTQKSTVIISNEAPFLLMAMNKVVFRMTQAGPVAINPDERDFTLPKDAPGLSFTIEDEGSSKPFMKTPISANFFANPRDPFVFPVGHLYLAKSSVAITWSNEHPTETYIPFAMLIGAKLYIDNKGTLGSLVSGQ